MPRASAASRQSTSPSAAARAWPSWARTAAARRRCSATSTDSCGRRLAASLSAAQMPPRARWRTWRAAWRSASRTLTARSSPAASWPRWASGRSSSGAIGVARDRAVDAALRAVGLDGARHAHPADLGTSQSEAPRHRLAAGHGVPRPRPRRAHGRTRRRRRARRRGYRRPATAPRARHRHDLASWPPGHPLTRASWLARSSAWSRIDGGLPASSPTDRSTPTAAAGRSAEATRTACSVPAPAPPGRLDTGCRAAATIRASQRAGTSPAG